MGFMQESIGLSNGFALTVVAYIVGFIVYMLYVDKYYEKLKNKEGSKKEHKGFLSEYMEHEIYTINENKTVRDAITFFTEKILVELLLYLKQGNQWVILQMEIL